MFLLCGITVSACESVEKRIHQGYEIAQDTGMQTEILNAGSFKLFTSSKRAEADKTLHVVIEGDGLAYLEPKIASKNPTPSNPIGLRIASKLDGNVTYLARPCQFIASPRCHYAYWTSNRFAPEILESYTVALNHLKQDTGANAISITGYSGGAYIAMKLAENRNDITEVITIAGLLNPQSWTSHHQIGALQNVPSAMPHNSATRYTHFCGEDDDVMPCHIFASETASLAHRLISVPNADHDDVWEGAIEYLDQQGQCEKSTYRR